MGRPLSPLQYTPQTVTVNPDDKQTLTFRDKALQSLIINKYEDGTSKPLSGVTFLVTDTNGARIGAGEYVTDQNGQIVIPGLTPGMTVVVREVRTVRGYVLNGNPQTITIGTGGASVSARTGTGSGAAVSGTAGTAGTGTAGTGAAGTGNTLNFYDQPLSVLLIHKYIEGTDNEPLANVEFKLTDSSGAEVGNGTYYTDNTGEIRVENLVPGTDITIRETKTVDGYLLDGTPRTVKIPGGDVKEVVFWNARMGQLQIKKMDAATKEPISGVTFKVTRSDGTVVGATNGEYRTDATGIIAIRDLKPDTYVIREIQAADGYLLDDNARTIEIKDGKTYTVEFFNEKLGGLVIHKLDSVTKEPLAGVQFKLTYADGTFVGQGNQGSNGLYTTDKDGQIAIHGISGTVIVTEQQALEGYRIDRKR